MRKLLGTAFPVGLLAAGSMTMSAGPITLPNASFESPATTFVDLRIDGWERTAKPADYDESGGFQWAQLTGAFKNSAPGASDHLDNCDGNQAIWMFAVPMAGLFQDYNAVDWSNAVPTHAFSAQFEVGKSYTLTAGVNGGGGNMLPGAMMELRLYYRDASSNMVVLAATAITNTPQNFPTHTHLTDFQAALPVVQAGDAWAGQHIGVLVLSTVSSNLQGGYWDIDNVRLASIREPVLTGATRTNGQFQFKLQGEPGTVFEILASSSVTTGISNWTSVGIITNQSGAAEFAEPAVNRRFYRARQLP